MVKVSTRKCQSTRKKTATRKHPTETQEQKAVIQFWAIYAKGKKLDERLLMHTANERKTSPRQGAQLKAMGVRAGWPDLFLAMPAGDYHGLFIEMKAKHGKLSDAQKELHPILREQGYLVVVCYGALEAMDMLKRYVTEARRVHA